MISNDPNFRLAEEAANSDAGINIQSDRLNVHKGARGIQSATGLSGNSLPTRHGLSFLESRSGLVLHLLISLNEKYIQIIHLFNIFIFNSDYCFALDFTLSTNLRILLVEYSKF